MTPIRVLLADDRYREDHAPEQVQNQQTTIVGQESGIQDREARLARLEAILARDT